MDAAVGKMSAARDQGRAALEVLRVERRIEPLLVAIHEMSDAIEQACP